MKNSRYSYLLVLAAFCLNAICPAEVWAYGSAALTTGGNTPLHLPKPGVMVRLSAPMNPPILKGIKVHADDPFRFDFILDTGETPPLPLRDEATRLIKYFLASLTIPEKDLWVTY